VDIFVPSLEELLLMLEPHRVLVAVDAMMRWSALSKPTARSADRYRRAR
jgi:hypothetical protein